MNPLEHGCAAVDFARPLIASESAEPKKRIGKTIREHPGQIRW